MPNPLHCVNHKVDEKAFDWKINTRDLIAREPDLLALDNDDKVLYSSNPLCLSIQSEIIPGDNKYMALTNLSTSENNDSETKFTSAHT